MVLWPILFMSAEAAILVGNSLEELERLNQFLSSFCSEHSLPEEFGLDINLALEEVFVNAVRYGYKDATTDEIRVRLAIEGDLLAVTLDDGGVAFNPLEAPEVDIHAPAEGRPIGGLGIHLVRNLMDQVEYSRANGRNVLTMKKRVPPGSLSASQ
jgi:serine/threonine-protein kinase RsbW